MPRTLESQITLEKTPSYFVTQEAPRRIFNMSRDTKLIVVVRNPVTRAISDYTQTLSKKPDIPTFEGLSFRNRTLGLVDVSWNAIRIGMLITDKHFYFNKTKGFPCLKKTESSLLPRCLGKSKGRTHVQIDPEVIDQLREFYRPYNIKFYETVGQDFSLSLRATLGDGWGTSLVLLTLAARGEITELELPALSLGRSPIPTGVVMRKG
ncbi:hypothetical protein E2I00_006200 [Balaenoptera physalus]|uniref:Uncharacterized protein n=1 Tax=Balaenoptera physalus TaxID=9770 RepID=A0A643BN96_BALPH|nr:hypothetical protein E2I00_006200 [Balaenoptera physalus]